MSDENIFLTSSKLSIFDSDIRHGFFTRRGGVSKGIYESLNCGPGSDDDKRNVVENRHIVIKSLYGSTYTGEERLNTLYQHHSADVISLENNLTDNADNVSEGIRADALVTNKGGIAIGVLTADCVPILFYEPRAKIIAAAHAGWKGAISGIVANTIEEMLHLGADTEHIIAAIGPAIAKNSYEVGAEFYQQFIDISEDNKRFFMSCCNKKYLFDIKSYVCSRLIEAGVAKGNIDILPHDTYTEDKLFFSNRRRTHANEQDYGRQVSAITLL